MGKNVHNSLVYKSEKFETNQLPSMEDKLIMDIHTMKCNPALKVIKVEKFIST